MDETPVATVFLQSRGEVLLLQRSDEVDSYAGKWGAVAGHVEDSPDESARREIHEETGIEVATLVRRGEPFAVEDEDLGVRWLVHPFLFESPTRKVRTNWETTDYEWVPPAEILRRETVPDLWKSYDRVAPTVESLAGDRERGSAALSTDALAVLRDHAGVLATEGVDSGDAWAELAALARDLLAARPSMAVLTNRVNRAMTEVTGERTPGAVECTAIDGIERAFAADESAARRAAEVIAGKWVCTLSRSGTVRDALLGANPRPSVLLSESRPGREGIGVAEELAAAGLDVTLCADAAVAHLLREEAVEVVLVGADSVLPDGRVVNKVGTRAAALAAAHEGIPCYAVAATDKVAPDEEPHLEYGEDEQIYDGSADVAVQNPTFDVTDADLLDGIVTEDGVLDARDVTAIAEELCELASWE